MRLVDEDALKTKVMYADIAPEAKDALFDMVDACRVSDAVPRSEYERLIRERDAAVAELEILQACEDCKWYNANTHNCEDVEPDGCTWFESHWEWRGVQDE